MTRALVKSISKCSNAARSATLGLSRKTVGNHSGVSARLSNSLGTTY